MGRYTPFERRRRRIARFSLYGSFLLVAAITAAFWVVVARPTEGDRDTDWSEVSWEEEPGVRLLQQFLRVDTGPDGDELAGALFLSTPLRAAGLSPEILSLGDHHANLRAVLPGTRSEQVVLLSHLDVEPVAEPDRWDLPPFSGRLRGPMIWGRGAFDMKSYTAAQLWALLALAARPDPPARTVSLIATSEEERGSELGIRWILWQRPDWFDETWAVLTEGGLVEARTLSDPKYWAIEVGQRTFVLYEVCSGSRERLELLREDLRRGFATDQHEIVMTEPVRSFLLQYWPSRDRSELRRALSDPDRLTRDPATVRSLPPYLRSLMANEAGASEPRPDPEGGWTMRLVLQILPGVSVEEQRRRLLPAWKTAGLSLAPLADEPVGGTSPLDHEAFRIVRAELRERYSEVPVGPFVLPSVMTDGQYLRSLDLPVYGVTPFLMLTPETLRAANRNEKIPAPALVRGIELYFDLLEELAG